MDRRRRHGQVAQKTVGRADDLGDVGLCNREGAALWKGGWVSVATNTASQHIEVARGRLARRPDRPRRMQRKNPPRRVGGPPAGRSLRGRFLLSTW
jgi:hypothetical protein